MYCLRLQGTSNSRSLGCDAVLLVGWFTMFLRYVTTWSLQVKQHICAKCWEPLAQWHSILLHTVTLMCKPPDSQLVILLYFKKFSEYNKYISIFVHPKPVHYLSWECSCVSRKCKWKTTGNFVVLNNRFFIFIINDSLPSPLSEQEVCNSEG
jgi:hypothetical protein